MEKHHVIIVGGGCSGLKTAWELAKKGIDVLILEKNKQVGYKVCAGGLTKRALAVCGFPDSLLQRRFKKILIVRRKKPENPIEIKRTGLLIATINRADMNKYMAEQAKNAGARIRTGSEVTKVKKNSVIVNSKKEIGFDYLVGADGSMSVVRASLGLKTKKVLSAFQYIIPKHFKNLELVLDFDKFGPTYAWIFPYKNSTSIGTGADLAIGSRFMSLGDLKRNFDDWCRSFIDIKKARLEGWVINYDYQGFDFGNKFLVGDAGGFASGLTGEGMYFAMASGIDVANRIINPKYKTVNINHSLRVKRFEELILQLFEANKTLARMVFGIFALLLKIGWVERKLVSLID